MGSFVTSISLPNTKMPPGQVSDSMYIMKCLIISSRIFPHFIFLSFFLFFLSFRLSFFLLFFHCYFMGGILMPDLWIRYLRHNLRRIPLCLSVHSPLIQMCSLCSSHFCKEIEILLHGFVHFWYHAWYTDFFVLVWKLSDLRRVFLLIGMKRWTMKRATLQPRRELLPSMRNWVRSSISFLTRLEL